jgi:integrase
MSSKVLAGVLGRLSGIRVGREDERRRPVGEILRARRVGREYRCEEPGCGATAAAHRIYDLRHTFASWSLAAGISAFELAWFMGTSMKIIYRHDGHRVRDSEDTARAKPDAYASCTEEGTQPPAH